MISHRAMANPPPPAPKVYTRSHLPGVLNNSKFLHWLPVIVKFIFSDANGGVYLTQ